MSLLRLLPLPLRRHAIDAVLGGIAAARRPAWRPARHDEAAAPGDVVVSGFLNDVSGVGRAARMTVEALERAGLPVIRHDLRPVFANLARGGLELPGRAEGGVWVVHANAPEAEAAFAAHRPADWASRRRIAYWAWETPLAPKSWTRVAPFFHEIWAPSRFTRDAIAERFKLSGATDLVGRLRVVPHPAPRSFAVDAGNSFWGEPPRAFKGLAMFDARSAAARKNPQAAVAAWTSAFPEPSSEAMLLVKAVGLERNSRERRRLLDFIRGRSDIRLIEVGLSDAEVRSLIASCDVLVSLHRSEGFGLVLAEAMACGRPVLATGWSGNVDFMDDGNACLVPYRLVPIRDDSGTYSGSVWAEPDLQAAAQALRRLRSDPELGVRLGTRAEARVKRLDDAWAAEAVERRLYP